MTVRCRIVLSVRLGLDDATACLVADQCPAEQGACRINNASREIDHPFILSAIVSFQAPSTTTIRSCMTMMPCPSTALHIIVVAVGPTPGSTVTPM